MISAGGPGYRWRGRHIRAINRRGIDCVTLPRKDSCIIIPAKINSNSIYRVSITAKNASGNCLIAVRFVDTTCECNPVYVASKEFSSIYVDVIVRDVSKVNTTLEIYKPKNSSGNILVSDISVINVGTVTEDDIADDKVKSISAAKIDSNKRKVEAAAKIEGRKKVRDITKQRNKKLAKVIKWGGRNIKEVNKFGKSCANLYRLDSTLLLPVSVKPHSIYRVSISASKLSQASELLVSFSAGRGLDAPAKLIRITTPSVKSYAISLKTPKAFMGRQPYLKIWVPNGSTTPNVIISDVTYTFASSIGVDKPLKRVSKPIKPGLPKKIFNNKEDIIMKFRPYKFNKSRIIDQVKEVLISSEDQVPKVSIVTPTRDGLKNIEACWKAIQNNTAYPNWEWVVGDSESTDGTVEFMESINDDRVKFIKRGTTDGSFSSINNELVEHADGEYLLFLNDDTEPQAHWLYNMMLAINNKPDIGIVGARLLYPSGKIQHAGIAFMNEGPGNLGKSVLKSFPNGFAERNRYYQAVTGACMLMRKEDFNRVGGFGLEYWFCYEDIDLCLKVIHQLNKKILYVSNAELIHKESVTQDKFKTAGPKQKAGIDYFKNTWMHRVKKDFYTMMRDGNIGVQKVDVSFVACVNNTKQYNNYVMGSIFKNDTKKVCECVPIFNFGNAYSASKALNIGLNKSQGKHVVFLHQDVLIFKNWIDMLYERIGEIETRDKKWGVLGTAGITAKDDTAGIVYNVKGSVEWQSTVKKKTFPVQTVDEHCMIIRRASGLRFDESYDGFHMYGPDICLRALSCGMNNYGILCPLVHNSGSGSLASGKKEFMKYLNLLNVKWGSKVPVIRTPTSVINRRSVKTFITFK